MSYQKVRLSDIAKETHVSHATVSAILNGKEGGSIRYSQETSDAVRRKAREMGYVPNQAARNLQHGNPDLIAVFTYEDIFPVESQTEFYDFFVGVQKEAERLGYDLLILNTRKNLSSSRLTLASGAVMIGVNRNDQDIKALASQEYPLVFVGRRAIEELDTHWVTFDYQAIITEVFSRIPASCRGVLILKQAHAQSEPSQDKEQAIRTLCQERGLPVVCQAMEQVIPEESVSCIRQGWFVMVDRLSLVPSLDGCLDAMGFSLGKEVHGFVLEDDWMGTGIRWSHWTNERKRLGQLAVTHLTAMIENGETAALPYLVPLSFVSGASC